MAMIIGVRFREVGRVYYFDPGEHSCKRGDRVIVETARGVECGEVVQENTDVPEEEVKRPLKLMIRKATPEDLANVESKAVKEAEAFKVCEDKIRKHGLDMSLVNVEYTFDASKIIFHFTADQRVDFRALVRDLAGVFRTRIELRQIGVRDEAKLLGGLGVCGRPFCCSLFMGDFHPVSIKMAKEQGLSLNPTKISGTCGRLMCCLKYEEAAYEDALKTLPKVGSVVETPDGKGYVTEVNAVSQSIKVKLERRSDAPAVTFQFSAEQGVTRKPQALRESALLGPIVPTMEDSFAQPEPQPQPPKNPQQQRQKQRGQGNRQQKQGQQKQGQPGQQKPGQPGQQKQGQRGGQHNRGGQSPGAANAEARSRAASAEGKAQPPEQNWRERHAPRKKEAPVYREEPRRAQPARPPQQKQGQPRQAPKPQNPPAPKPPQPQPQPPSAANSIDSRRAEGAPRRANAPKPADPPSGPRRAPWQKKRGPKPEKPKSAE